jgi:hypothetical protein
MDTNVYELWPNYDPRLEGSYCVEDLQRLYNRASYDAFRYSPSTVRDIRWTTLVMVILTRLILEQGVAPSFTIQAARN